MHSKPQDAEVKFLEPPEPEDVPIPDQHELYQLPVRFGSVPRDEAPLGWVVETRPPRPCNCLADPGGTIPS